MTKNSQRNTKEQNTSIVKDFFRQVGNEKKLPLTQSFFVKLQEALIEYAQRDDVYFIKPFFREQRIHSDTIARWQEKYPEFKRTYQFAKEIISERREAAAAGLRKQKFDVTVWAKTQHLYDNDAHLLWRDDQAYLAKTKSENNDNERTIVVLKDYPEAT